LACGLANVQLTPDPRFSELLRRSVEFLERQLPRPTYGVTTGVGASVHNIIPAEWQAALPANLYRFHGCGTGRVLGAAESRAVVAARLASLASGYSAVRPEVLQALCDLLNHDIAPLIFEEGSVGASGDLTPLSYIAAVLCGEREVLCQGEVMPASDALAGAGLVPLTLQIKESLALMNGTSFMTGLACLAFERSKSVARWACTLTGLCSEATAGNPEHFDTRLFAAKPHWGSVQAATWIRSALDRNPAALSPQRLQDRYSLRCAPHVIGVLVDALAAYEPWLTTELNSANDNPLVFAEDEVVLHGGNFYGGHVTFVLDGLKVAVANVADLLDRQLMLLCAPQTNGGLPADLVGVTGPEAVVHHGFKAMQISTSALAAEALKLSGPASVFTRSTEGHNQDKVSMGAIAAREALRILELCETVAAIHTLAICQAADLRGDRFGSAQSRSLRAAVRAWVPMLTVDRRQDVDISQVLKLYREGGLPISSREAAGQTIGVS
jgi:histidine ammonia-lyase